MRNRRKRFGGASIARDRAASATWMVYTRLPTAWKGRLQEISRLSGWSLQETIRRAIAEFLGNPEEEELIQRVMEKWGPVYERNRSSWEPSIQLSQQLFVQRILERREREKQEGQADPSTSP